MSHRAKSVVARGLAAALLRTCVSVAVLLSTPSRASAQAWPPELEQAGVVVQGQAVREGETVAFRSKRSRIVVAPKDPEAYRIELEVELAPKRGSTEVALGSAASSSDPHLAEWRVSLRRTEGEGGEALLFQPMRRAETGKWSSLRGGQRSLQFPAKPRGKTPTASTSSRKKQWWKLGLERSGDSLRLLFDGQTLLAERAPAGSGTNVIFRFAEGDRVRGLRITEPRADAFLPLELGRAATQVGSKVTADELAAGGVPFKLADQGRSAIDLRRASWPEWKQDPSSTREGYDAPPAQYPDPRRPLLWAPSDDYVALHLLATATQEPGTEPQLSATIGSFGTAGQVRHYAYEARVPQKPSPALDTVNIRASRAPVAHVRIPLNEALRDVLPDVLQIAFNKQLRLAVRQPDPSRFRYRPLGLPSSVKVWAVTLERSPLRMSVRCDEPGNAFVDPATPTFRVNLRNLTVRAEPYVLKAVATHTDGHRFFQERAGEVPAGERQEVILPTPVVRRGYYDYRIELRRPNGDLLLAKSSSFAWLMPRRAALQAASPFGTWDFSGAHFTSDDPRLVGSLYQKLGFRYGMFGFTPDERAASGVIQGREPVILGDANRYFTFRQTHPDAPRVALLMHEHVFSGQHAHRVPDIFHDRGRYILDAAEAAKLKDLVAQAESAARALRTSEPAAHLRLGNGLPTTKEELYRQGFPAELFDSAGNEAAVFGRPPEAQPPDMVAMNASLWMDRRLLDHYGYSDKPVTQCFETCYPSTNPGNLSLTTQADYFARHALHGLAWRLPVIKLGMIMDAGNSYYHSNWGAAGLCTARPDVRAKPAFVAMATLTNLLGDAKFEGKVELGSTSLYALDFSRADGSRILALWTLRGRRSIELQLAPGSSASWRLTDGQGNSTLLRPRADRLALSVGTAPVYLEGTGRVSGGQGGPPDHRDAAPAHAAPVSALDSLDDWVVEDQRDMNLEFHNPLTPRRKGELAVRRVSDLEGRTGALRVALRASAGGPDTMPLYGALRHRRGLPLPGRPTALAILVNGNSGFGRVIFELEDASGQRWTSIGASGSAVLSAQVLALIPPEFAAYKRRARLADWNTDDVFGLSRINFDGWRHVSIPLPGNYPGEGYGWPANSQWMHDGDGQIHYPLKLRRLIVELPQKTLHVTAFLPAPRPEIYLSELLVEHGDPEWRAPLGSGAQPRKTLQ